MATIIEFNNKDDDDKVDNVEYLIENEDELVEYLETNDDLVSNSNWRVEPY